MNLDERSLYQYIGSRIRAARVAAGLTQRQMAEYLGVERTSVTNIESGQQKPPIHVLYRLCIRLGVEARDVLPPVAEVSSLLAEDELMPFELDDVPPKTAEIIRTLLDDLPEER